VLSLVDERVDIVLLDGDHKASAAPDPAALARARLKKATLLTYSDRRTWVDAVVQQLTRLAGEHLAAQTILVAGDHPAVALLAEALSERNVNVRILSVEDLEKAENEAAVREARAVIAWGLEGPVMGPETVGTLGTDVLLLDAGIGSIAPEGIEAAYEHGLTPVRVNMWPCLAGLLEAAHEYALVVHEAFGRGVIDGVPVVAGGAVGRRGDVIVDSIRNPSRVIGMADGDGGVRFAYSEEQAARIAKVKEAIHRRLISPPVSKDT
jgi:hypothetical protein